MSHQELNKDNDNVFIQFDTTAELIIELIFEMLDRNNKSVNIANVINDNVTNEKNDYQVTFDVPTEIEIQKDMEDVFFFKKKPPSPPPPYVMSPLLTAKEREVG